MHACTEEGGITQPLHQRGLSIACMHVQRREGGANCLQVVTKDTLEDQVGLSISIVRLASRGGIQLASLKEIFFLFQMQLSAKCLVIFQLTISILKVLRRQRTSTHRDGCHQWHWHWQEWHAWHWQQ